MHINIMSYSIKVGADGLVPVGSSRRRRHRRASGGTLRGASSPASVLGLAHGWPASMSVPRPSSYANASSGDLRDRSARRPTPRGCSMAWRRDSKAESSTGGCDGSGGESTARRDPAFRQDAGSRRLVRLGSAAANTLAVLSEKAAIRAALHARGAAVRREPSCASRRLRRWSRSAGWPVQGPRSGPVPGPPAP